MTLAFLVESKEVIICILLAERPAGKLSGVGPGSTVLKAYGLCVLGSSRPDSPEI